MTDLFPELPAPSTAVLSSCRLYRYELWRRWDASKPHVLFIGLNPSTADETTDDPTIRKCVTYAKTWGYGALCMANLFAWRATDPDEMKIVSDPIGPENDATLVRLSKEAPLTVVAWGNHGTHLSRSASVLGMLGNVHCLHRTKEDQPGHPLFLSANLAPVLFSP
ncbi:MAG: DUF1643 domain-containing protein [Verrucomicrobiota bacterium]